MQREFVSSASVLTTSASKEQGKSPQMRTVRIFSSGDQPGDGPRGFVGEVQRPKQVVLERGVVSRVVSGLKNAANRARGRNS